MEPTKLPATRCKVLSFAEGRRKLEERFAVRLDRAMRRLDRALTPDGRIPEAKPKV